jgi:hypothetical protein
VGIPLGPRTEQAKFPRNRGNGIRKPRGKLKPEPKGAQEQQQPHKQERPDQSGVVEKLFAKFSDFDPSWPDDLKAKWFEGFDQFMKKAATDQ